MNRFQENLLHLRWAEYLSIQCQNNAIAMHIVNYIFINKYKFNRCIAFVKKLDRAKFIYDNIP